MIANDRMFSTGKAVRAMPGRRLAIEPLESREMLSGFTVTSSKDDGGMGTLRYGIMQVNKGNYSEIDFAVSTAIVSGAPLPALEVPCTINGTIGGGGGSGDVAIHGSGTGAKADGIVVNASGCVVENVAIFGFSSSQIFVGGSGDFVNNCYVGTTYRGKSAASKQTCYGIQVDGSGNYVNNNVISGCTGYAGLYVLGSGATGNNIFDNFIGTDMTGTLPIPNAQSGVIVQSGANGNNFYHNVISANKIDGVDVGGVGTSNNRFFSNYIGTNLGGTSGGNLGNGRNGVDVYGGATNNTIGGDLDAIGQANGNVQGGNLISNNHKCGVCVFDTDANVTQGNIVKGNYIGTDIDGLVALPNLVAGVTITNGAAFNYVGYVATGGSSTRYGNLISGNKQEGVLIGIYNPSDSPAHDNTIEANFIGTDRNGVVPAYPLVNPLANGNGIYINGGMNNTIGASSRSGPVGGTGTDTGESALPDPASNIIAGNTDDGVRVASGTGDRISLNQVFGNLQMGIDLGAADQIDGPQALPQSGPNNMQNYPVLTSVTDSGGQTTIAGTLQAVAGQTSYWVEFYANGRLSGKGGLSEGQWFLGAQEFSDIDANHQVGIRFTTDTPADNSTGPYGASGPVLDHLITAVAIDANGNTSEFSAARDVLRNAVANDSGAASLQINSQIPQAYKAAMAAYDNSRKTYPSYFDTIFQPNKILGVTPTVDSAAKYCDVAHFNWLQYVTLSAPTYVLVPNPQGTIPVQIGTSTVEYSSTGSALTYPVVDPILNFPSQVYGVALTGPKPWGVVTYGKAASTDGLPYYMDDTQGASDPLSVVSYQAGLRSAAGSSFSSKDMFGFCDAPTVQNASGAGPATFIAGLAGVPVVASAAPVQWVGLNTNFQWVATQGKPSALTKYLNQVIGPGTAPSGVPASAGRPSPRGTASAVDVALMALAIASPTIGTAPSLVQSAAGQNDAASLASLLAVGATQSGTPWASAADNADLSGLSSDRLLQDQGPVSR